MTRILVIEDNQDNLDLMTYLLQAFGHATMSTTDGEQGLATARREVPDLIVCDIHLPGIDGYEVAHQLKSTPGLSAIPLVAVTALAMVGDRDKVLAAGFDGYIAKPIDPEKFVAQVEAFLRPGQPPSQPLARPEPIPAVPAPAASASPSEASPLPAGNVPRGGALSVLVVDDSAANRELVRQTLEPFGYRVRLAHDVQEGLAMARRQAPDLIISDLHMPYEDGFSFIQQIKHEAELAAIPFIFISASLWGDQDRVHALQLGAVRFIQRPFEPQTLLDEIDSCLASYQEAS